MIFCIGEASRLLGGNQQNGSANPDGEEDFRKWSWNEVLCLQHFVRSSWFMLPFSCHVPTEQHILHNRNAPLNPAACSEGTFLSHLPEDTSGSFTCRIHQIQWPLNPNQTNSLLGYYFFNPWPVLRPLRDFYFPFALLFHSNMDIVKVYLTVTKAVVWVCSSLLWVMEKTAYCIGSASELFDLSAGPSTETRTNRRTGPQNSIILWCDVALLHLCFNYRWKDLTFIKGLLDFSRLYRDRQGKMRVCIRFAP